jgi:hypothetical protein
MSRPQRERVTTDAGIEVQCPKCGELWPETREFYGIHPSHGTQSWCKACVAQDTRDRRLRAAAAAPVGSVWALGTPSAPPVDLQADEVVVTQVTAQAPDLAPTAEPAAAPPVARSRCDELGVCQCCCLKTLPEEDLARDTDMLGAMFAELKAYSEMLATSRTLVDALVAMQAAVNTGAIADALMAIAARRAIEQIVH